MRKLLILAVVLPLTALAQGSAPAAGQGQGSAAPGGKAGPWDPARAEKRMRLARTLGLAEILDLDTAQALKLGDTLAKYDDRRLAARKQMHEARQVLKRAASGEKASQADVDAAIGKFLDGRAQLLAGDKEMVQAVVKDLPAEKRARAALFLGRFEHRIEQRAFRMHGGPGMGPGGRGPGMGPGGGRGRMMGPGNGQSGMMMGPGPGMALCDGMDCPQAPGDDDDLDE